MATPVVRPGANAIGKTNAKPSINAAAKTPTVVASNPGTTKTVAKPAAHVVAQNNVAFDVPAKKSAPKAKTHVAAAKHPPAATKPPASTTQYHPPQVVHP